MLIHIVLMSWVVVAVYSRRKLPYSVTYILLVCKIVFFFFVISAQHFTRNSIIYESACSEVLCEFL